MTNPNHLNHFLRNFHASLGTQQKLYGLKLPALHAIFKQFNVSPLILRFIEERGVVPTPEMDRQRMLMN